MFPRLLLVVIAVLVVASCGGTPTAPAETPGGTQPTSQAGSKSVSTEGLVSGLIGSCPTIIFTVNYTAVTTSAQTAFTKASCEQVRNGMKVTVLGSMPANGKVITATTVDCEYAKPSEEVVSGLTGSCPTLTFVVDGTTIRTTAQTSFVGVACNGLRNGLKVRVQGAKQSDGSVIAATIWAD